MTAKLVAVASLVSVLVFACGRDAEIFGEEQATERDSGADRAARDVNVTPTPPDGGVPVLVEAGLDFEPDACSGRSVTCPSTADFPCQRFAWYGKLIELCKERAGCASGWLSIRLENPGCASEIGMTDLNPAFATCMVEQLNLGACPCPPEVTNTYLGPSCP